MPEVAGRALWVSTSLTTRGGISAYVRTIRESDLWSVWNVDHVATHRNGSVFDRLVAFGGGVVAFLDAVVRRRPDIIHLHTSSHGSFARKSLLFWFASVFGIPAVLHVHGSEFDAYFAGSPALLRAYITATLGHAAAVVALGERWGRCLSTMAPRARVVVIPNAVRARSARDHELPGRLTVVFLGEIGERKGAFTLIEAWAAVMADGRPADSVELVLAGDRDTARARTAVERFGIGDSCRIQGWLSPHDTQSLLSDAHVLALPSRSEGQPMAVLEAMAAGLCVVASPVGGIPELIDDGRSGLLVEPGDVPALAVALRRTLDDPTLRARLGGAAHSRIRNEFDVEVVWRSLDELYRSILQRQKVG